MSELDTIILQVTEPTIKLDELSIYDIESEENRAIASVKPSKFLGAFVPFIVINRYEIGIDELVSLEMNTSGFLPTIRLTIDDKLRLFMSRNFPRDGDVISFLIRSNNEEIFKPIKIDFEIVSIQPSFVKGSSNKPVRFNINGQMKIPGLLTEFNEAYREMSSLDTLLNISQNLQLGFASNVEITNDIMTWINPYDTRIRFIKDIVSKSYADENSFFISYIDAYYVLNFINVNKLFSAEDSILESEVYSIGMTDISMGVDETQGSDVAPLLLTNHPQFAGSSKYLSSFQMFNNSGNIFLKNGYKRYAQFYDVNNEEYISEFVDPLTTEGLDDHIHLKGRYVKNGDVFEPEGIIDIHFKYKYLGKSDVSNVHENYLFSSVLNYQNEQEIGKMGMIVNLDIADLTLTKYQRIPIYVFDFDIVQKQIPTEESNVDNGAMLNEYLSGYYIITNISYYWDKPGPIKQRLKLIKREFIAPK